MSFWNADFAPLESSLCVCEDVWRGDGRSDQEVTKVHKNFPFNLFQINHVNVRPFPKKDVKRMLKARLLSKSSNQILWLSKTRYCEQLEPEDYILLQDMEVTKKDSEETHKTLSYAEFWNCLESVIHSILNPRHASRKGRLLTWTRTAWKRKTRAETLRYAGGSGSEGAQHQRQIVFIPIRGHITSLNNCRCSSDNCNFGSQIKSSPIFAFLLLLVPISSTWRDTQTWFLHKDWHWLSHKHKSLFSPTAL